MAKVELIDLKGQVIELWFARVAIIPMAEIGPLKGNGNSKQHKHKRRI